MLGDNGWLWMGEKNGDKFYGYLSLTNYHYVTKKRNNRNDAK